MNPSDKAAALAASHSPAPSLSPAAQVGVRQCGRVRVITLQRPDRRNAVDTATAQALHAAFLAFERDAQSDVAVLAGEGGHFCAGWDLQAGAQMVQGAGVGAGADSGHSVAQTLAQSLDFDANEPLALGPMGPTRMRLSKPVIAAITGAAVAGGMELALWCDMRVMEESAYFGVYCRRFGVPLIDGGTVRLPCLIGMSQAMDLILTGRQVLADEALRMGLCHRVVAPNQALEAALALAQQIAAFPQATLRADRASALASQGLTEAAALQQEWQRGKACLGDALRGAARFTAGEGRHGDFSVK